METWELAAREHVRELIARYARCADRGAFRELVLLFAEEGILEIDGRAPLRGRLATQAFLEGVRDSRLRKNGTTYVRHHVSSLAIDVSDPENASAESYFLVLRPHGLDHWGRYRDRFVQVGERWLLAHRRVRLDGRARDEGERD